MPQPIRRSRASGAPSGAVVQHSLLVDNNDGRASNRPVRDAFLGNASRRHRGTRDASEYNEWISSIEDMIGTGAGQLLEQVLGNMRSGDRAGPPAGPPPIVHSMPVGGGATDLIQNLISSLHGRPGTTARHRTTQTTQEAPATTEAQMLSEAISNPILMPYSTVDRWNEEAAIFSGGMQASERLTLISRSVSIALMPEKHDVRKAEEKEKAAREKEIREREEREEREQLEAEQKREAEEAEAAKSNADDKQEADAVQEPTSEVMESTAEASASQAPAAPATPAAATTLAESSGRPSWRERVERRRQAQAAQQSSLQQALSSPAPASSATPSELSEVLDLAARLSGVDTTRSGTGTPQAPTVQEPASSEDHTMEEDQPVVVEEEDATIEASPSTSQAENVPQEPENTQTNRVIIEIRGNMVDITDTGIDPTFLEALPDDMREEVLNQHFRETRAASAAARASGSAAGGSAAAGTSADGAAAPIAVPEGVSSEFLDALPPELRAEVLAQEAEAQARARRLQQAAQRAAAAPTAGGEEQDANAAPVPPQDMALIDPATFLASLDPGLRETILLDQGEEMLGALPPNLLAE